MAQFRKTKEYIENKRKPKTVNLSDTRVTDEGR